MEAVGRLGSYISRVSGPFHPFGGAIDIIVVLQPDGSYKSSPWYVKFGKFQGVLKTKEKLVSISVNGVEADFHMHLNHRGEACFLKEVDIGEGEAACSPPSSSGEDTENNSDDRMPMKSKSYNSGGGFSDSVVSGIDGKAIPRTNSRRSRLMGFVFGRKSMKEVGIPDDVNASGDVRRDSMERAEIAADLLELKWSTNLTSSKFSQDNGSSSSTEDVLKDVKTNLLANGCADDETCLVPQSSYQEMETNVEEKGMEMKCLNAKDVIEQATSMESIEEEATLANSEPLTFTENFGFVKEGCDVDSVTLSDMAYSNSTNQDSAEEQNGMSDASFSKLENGADTNPCFYSETSKSSRVGLKESPQQGSPRSSECAKEHVHAENSVTKPVSESGRDVRNEALNIQEYIRNGVDMTSFEEEIIPMYSAPEKGSYSQAVHLHPSDDFIPEVGSQNGVTISSLSNSTCAAIDERTNLGEDQISGGSFLGPVHNPWISSNDYVTPFNPSSEISKEEQLLFGDMDDFDSNQAKHVDFSPSDDKGKEFESSISGRVSNGYNQSGHAECSSDLSLDRSVINDCNMPKRRLRSISSDNNISTTGGVKSYELTRRVRSLPSMSPLSNSFDTLDHAHSFSPSLLSSVILNDHQDVAILEGSKEGLANPPIENPPKSIDSPTRRSWSFSLRRSRSMKVSTPATVGIEKIPKSTNNFVGVEDVKKVRVNKKKVMTLIPTSEQLASLNLKEGPNIVIFTFSTAMLGKQQVDARIFLWKWDTRIVISDVDGTITRSDLLGQFMPFVGMDWSQSGVAHLFSSIKDNGYQMLFLSARAISQAFHTRRFLFNIKQDGKAMPDGPVVISPDGLFPSLFREVVRRAPHEFKIACLEDIKALFPAYTNPFYAGFGNRDTDEFSYLKVGIPKNKIFTINPKGEIVVNRRLDTKSYLSLHGLVHGMFPSISSSSEKEDFNSWNYWKLPPPIIDV